MVKNNMKVPETVHPQMTTQSLAAHPYADGKTVKFHSTQDISETLDDIKSFEADNIYIYFFGAYVELNTVIGASTLHHINVGVQREYALEWDVKIQTNLWWLCTINMQREQKARVAQSWQNLPALKSTS